MRTAVSLLSLLLLTTACAQPNPTGKFVPFPPTRTGDTAEPLVLKSIESSHFWISVDWPGGLPANTRLVNGKAPVPGAVEAVRHKMIQPEYIAPHYSPDPAILRQFRDIYLQGLEKFFGNQRTFRLTATSSPYAGPGQERGIFSFGLKPKDTLQYKMVRAGHATVEDPPPAVDDGHSERLALYPRPEPPYGKQFREFLLSAQEKARREHLGIWSNTTP